MLRLKTFLGIVVLAIAVSFSSCIKETESFLRETITFQQVNLAPETYWNGSDESGSKTFGTVTFYNYFEENEWGEYWEGFAFSNVTDIETEGYENEFSAYIAEGGSLQNVYSVAYANGTSAKLNFMDEALPISVNVTNSTLVYYTLLNGNQFSTAFDEGDWFLLTITGYDNNDEEVNSVDFYLADFREGQSIIVDEWTSVDLTSLNGSSSIVFSLSSSDTGEWGMNTPAYFCLDNFTIYYSN